MRGSSWLVLLAIPAAYLAWQRWGQTPPVALSTGERAKVEDAARTLVQQYTTAPITKSSVTMTPTLTSVYILTGGQRWWRFDYDVANRFVGKKWVDGVDNLDRLKG